MPKTESKQNLSVKLELKTEGATTFSDILDDIEETLLRAEGLMTQGAVEIGTSLLKEALSQYDYFADVLGVYARRNSVRERLSAAWSNLPLLPQQNSSEAFDSNNELLNSLKSAA